MIIDLYDKVKKLLQDYPSLRDNDNRLVGYIWRSESVYYEHEIIALLEQDKLTSFESITRCRRKAQELCPELRGKKWNERHGMAEEIKRDLKQLVYENKTIEQDTLFK